MTDDELDTERAVLADELQQRGDPQGELIALQLALEQLPPTAHRTRRHAIERRLAAQLDEHHDMLFGPLAPHVTRQSLPDLFDPALEVLRWRGGFAESLFVQRRLDSLEAVDVLRALHAVPIARFVRELVIGLGDHPAVIAELARERPSTLRALILNEWRRPIRKLRAVLLGEMTDELVALLGVLEHVELGRVLGYRTFESSTLRQLDLGITYNEPRTRFDARLPALRSLGLYGFEPDVALPDRYPHLERLHLVAPTYDASFLDRLLVGPRLPLRSLTLGWGLRDADLARIAEHEWVARLEYLELGGTFTPEVKEAARAKLPSLKFQ